MPLRAGDLPQSDEGARVSFFPANHGAGGKEELTLHVRSDTPLVQCCVCRAPLPVPSAGPSALATVLVGDFARHTAATARHSAALGRVHQNVLHAAVEQRLYSLFCCGTCERIVRNAQKNGFPPGKHPVAAAIDYLAHAGSTSRASPRGPLFKSILRCLFTRARRPGGHITANELVASSGLVPKPVQVLEQWAHDGCFSPDLPPAARENAVEAAYLLCNGLARWFVGADAALLRKLRGTCTHTSFVLLYCESFTTDPSRAAGPGFRRRNRHLWRE